MSSDSGPPIDFGGLLSQLGQMQQHLAAAQEEAAATVVEGSAGGGKVKVRVTGAFEFQEVTIDPSVVDPDDVDLLQDLVLAAVRDGIEKAGAMTAEAIGGPGGVDISGALGGLGLGGLLGE